MTCSLCSTGQDDIVWQDRHCRVILVPDPDYPGYCRVVWNRHVAEMSDLDTDEQHRFMDVVLAVERALRVLMNPDKINLASFGNKVPHLHWHVIARFADDCHFPESIWGHEQRQTHLRAAPDRDALTGQIATELARTSATC
ncbi:MAG: HIT family protein [Azoarcus sp.]|jgi:diadenosine tetraphosphate (Ap4A) HIT family hydrolase|nr:HIT family protein [Azoarcus sp.]